MDIAILAASYCGSSIAMTVVNASVARTTTNTVGILFFQTFVASVVNVACVFIVSLAPRSCGR